MMTVPVRPLEGRWTYCRYQAPIALSYNSDRSQRSLLIALN